MMLSLALISDSLMIRTSMASELFVRRKRNVKYNMVKDPIYS